MKKRCEWANGHELLATYHDTEWGVPVHEDRKLFEFILLDAAQAGLSWLTVLKKRENYRQAFNNFYPKKIARYSEKRILKLLDNPGIIRNRLKVRSAVQNARAFLKIQKEFSSFDAYIWQFVSGKPIHNNWQRMKDVPAKTKDSDAMSKDLKTRGFNFVGSTICYAFMQAAGMVNDHTTDCFRYRTIKSLKYTHPR